MTPFSKSLLVVAIIAVLGLTRNFHLAFNSFLPKSLEEAIFLPPKVKTEIDNDFPFTFSACLIVKDDNRILPEWLAYHYEVLPLRHLIIAVDPYSKISPEPILKEFRTLSNFTIEMWRDEDYLPKGAFLNDNATNLQRHELHRGRQKAFIHHCLNSLKRQNRTWTLLVDTDEYLVFNYYHDDDGEPWRCAVDKDDASRRECNLKFQQEIENKTHPRTRVPRIGERTAAHYIANELNQTDPYWHFRKPCVVFPRVLFSPEDSNETYAPDGFDVDLFYTLRYIKHQELENLYPGKPMIDASRYNGGGVSSPHRVSPVMCVNGPNAPYSEAMFRVQHYMGSAQVFMGRKSANDFQHRLNTFKVIGSHTEIYGWLDSFAKRVGKAKALELTQGLTLQAHADMKKLAEAEENTTMST